MKITAEQLILDGVVALTHQGYYDPETAAKRYHEIFFGSGMAMPRIIICDSSHIMFKRPSESDCNRHEDRLYGSSRADLAMVATIVGDEKVERLVCIAGDNEDLAHILAERYRMLGLAHKVDIVDNSTSAVSIVESVLEYDPSLN